MSWWNRRSRLSIRIIYQLYIRMTYGRWVLLYIGYSWEDFHSKLGMVILTVSLSMIIIVTIIITNSWGLVHIIVSPKRINPLVSDANIQLTLMIPLPYYHHLSNNVVTTFIPIINNKLNLNSLSLYPHHCLHIFNNWSSHSSNLSIKGPPWKCCCLIH